MKRVVLTAVVLITMGGTALVRVAADDQTNSDEAKVKRGFEIAPVPLTFDKGKRALVGLGSYIVNAQGDCAGCHSFPQFEPGGDPFLGEPTVVAQGSYLSGGAPFFGPFVPRNLTPNAAGRPAGYTLARFVEVLRTGKDLKFREPHVPSDTNDLLQIMPWPAFRNMTDRDLMAIYEYLKAIPCLDPDATGRCG